VRTIAQRVGRGRGPEFIAKLGIVVEEADESIFWLELLQETSFVQKHRRENLLKEANELTAIFAAARKTSRSR
jgi:four helix bundle protein